MLITPDSTVSLYTNVPIGDGMRPLFKTRAEQTTYFNSKRIASKANCTYLRKTGRLRIEWNTSRVMSSNYISFKNPSFENVTFYAKLVDFEYVNNTTTDVLYEIDWFESFCFDVEYHACGIERESLTQSDHEKAVANPWRRDIPELLTNEDLPVGESLEAKYVPGQMVSDSYIPTGNRFRLGSPIPLGNIDILDSMVLVMFLSSIRNTDDLEESQITTFRNFLSKWDTLNGSTFNAQTVNINTMFYSAVEVFPRSYAVLAMNSPTADSFSEAMSYLSALEITGNIVGLYMMPQWLLGDGEYDVDFVVPKLNVNNPKLNTYPFRYIRLKTPLDTKEYRIDLFHQSEIEGEGIAIGFLLSGNIAGTPMMCAIPQGYKRTDNKGNYFERLEYNNFPQMGFSCDTYLSYIGAQNRRNLVSDTTPLGQAENQIIERTNYNISTANLLSAGANVGSSFSNLGSDIMENPMGAAGNAFSSVANYHTAKNASDKASAEWKQNYLADLESQNLGRGKSIIYNNAKPAFIADEYHPSSGNGYFAYEAHRVNFLCEIVTLETSVLQKYDDYLTCYGYNSARYGIPHFADYIMNNTHAPHFGTFHGEKITYVKTADAHITGAPLIACRAIEQLLNGGCRFLKVVNNGN